MRDGLTYTQAVVRANAVYPTGNEGIDNYATSFMSALDSGYSEDYADAYATAASKGEDTVAAIQERAKNEIARAGINTEGLATFETTFGELWTSEKTDIINAITVGSSASGRVYGYTQEDWNRSFKKVYDNAIKKLNKTDVSETAKQYAVAEAVGKMGERIFAVYDSTGTYGRKKIPEDIIETQMYNALGTLFYGDLLDVAVKTAGLEAKPPEGETS